MFLKLATAEKDSTDHASGFVSCHTPKYEHDCKIKTDCFISRQIDALVGQFVTFSIAKKKIKNLMVDVVKNRCFEIEHMVLY